MTTATRNLGASVAARLLNRSKATGDDYQAVLRPLLLPVLDDVRRTAAVPGVWPPCGPWGPA